MAKGPNRNDQPQPAGSLGVFLGISVVLALGLAIGLLAGFAIKDPGRGALAQQSAAEHSTAAPQGGVLHLTQEMEGGTDLWEESREEGDDIARLSQQYYADIAANPLRKSQTQQRCDVWRATAAAFPEPPADAPRIAIIIDDMGVDKLRSARALALPGPLTFSYLPYARDLAAQTSAAKAAGHEVMMHMPMEPLSRKTDPGPNALTTDLSDAEIQNRLETNLERFDGFVGINNHMGSKFTADADGMRLVMLELRKRGLLFVDSMTSAQSVGAAVARRMGVPFLQRDIFLDHSNDPAVIGGQLVRLEALAISRGHAVAIGHPRDATIAALSAWLPKLSGKGMALVPVTALIDGGAVVSCASRDAPQEAAE